MTCDFTQRALEYHARPQPGKLAIQITKPCNTQADLALAYTPGVAEPVRAIAASARAAYTYTCKGNLVAVITDGSAVLGLGNVGPLAGKPVMEGKAVLFKRFADIDCFDIEVASPDPQAFVETVCQIAPTFGGINLEDIAAPHCFDVERQLIDRLDIPVFHDDQHGTAIIIAAGLLNALELVGKPLSAVKIVCVGAGAAGVASLRLLETLGAPKENILLIDRQGVVHDERRDINEYKREFARKTPLRTLAEATCGADVFIGVSGGDILKPDMLKSMAPQPVVFALSNPDPEIHPDVACQVRSDLVMATGRSDFPNQVNNVLGFPFIFRGALDVQARTINQAMIHAAVTALRDLAKQPVPPEVLEAYQVDVLSFGKDYFIPKPLDPRLRTTVAPAVAWAAVESGAARTGYPEGYPDISTGP